VLHFLQYNFAPHGAPWWTGATWPNVAAVVPCAILTVTLGWLWSRTKWWPLRPLEGLIVQLHVKFAAHREAVKALHDDVTKLTKWHERSARAHAQVATATNDRLDEHRQALDKLTDRIEALHAKHDAAPAPLDPAMLVRLTALALYVSPVPDGYDQARLQRLQAVFEDGARQILAGEEPAILKGLLANTPSTEEPT
jgi:hypothetical protein